MKIVIFAHTPPPHHGQSFMVKMVLDGLRREVPGARENERFECYHVNARFSEDVSQIGQAGLKKLWLAFKFSAQAIVLRLRHGVANLYYVPASATRSAVYRDWIIMALCRPFFRRVILHWQAAGLAEWLQKSARPWERAITRFLLRRPALCVVLGEELRGDGEYLDAKRVVVIPNAVSDPCPGFWQELNAVRQTRREWLARALAAGSGTAGEPGRLRVLYLSLCMREKGLFDAVEAIALANQRLATTGSGLRVQLTVAGKFYLASERREFEQRITKPDLNGGAPADAPVIRYLGFVSGEQKAALFRDGDCFCFPSFYPMEGHPVSLVEAMAHGLPVVATRWRALPDLLPENYPGLVNVRAPAELAEALVRVPTLELSDPLRRRYEQEYTETRFLERLKAAFLETEHDRD